MYIYICKKRLIYKLTLTAPNSFTNKAISLHDASGKTERAIVVIYGCPRRLSQI